MSLIDVYKRQGGDFGGHGASRSFGSDGSNPRVTPNAYSGGALGPLVMAYNKPVAVPDVYAGDTHLTVNCLLYTSRCV